MEKKINLREMGVCCEYHEAYLKQNLSLTFETEKFGDVRIVSFNNSKILFEDIDYAIECLKILKSENE